MKILMINVRCKYEAIEKIEDEELDEAYRGMVKISGELLTMHNSDEFVDKRDVEDTFKNFLRQENSILMNCIEYGLSSRRRNNEYSKVQLIADVLPLDNEVRKWKFKLEIEVVDKDYSEYLDVVADYQDVLLDPEFSVFELEKKVRATDLLNI
jgi:hypothetical protein